MSRSWRRRRTACTVTAIAVLACAGLSGCGSSSDPEPGANRGVSPAFSQHLEIAGVGYGPAPTIGLTTVVRVTPTSCTFTWATVHPPGPKHQVTLTIGQTVTITTLRPAQITLLKTVTTGPPTCDLNEYDPPFPN